MKTNVLFAAALLLSTASFAQNINANTDASSSSSATVSTSTVEKTATAGEQRSQAIKTKASAEKAKATTTTASALKDTHEAVKENMQDQASVKADGSVNTSVQNNKLSQDASLNGQANVSTAGTDRSVKSLKTKTRADVKTAGSETVNTATQARKAAATTTAKPAPATIKIHNQVKSNAGIKIK